MLQVARPCRKDRELSNVKPAQFGAPKKENRSLGYQRGTGQSAIRNPSHVARVGQKCGSRMGVGHWEFGCGVAW